jgi:hypothetical protein
VSSVADLAATVDRLDASASADVTPVSSTVVGATGGG